MQANLLTFRRVYLRLQAFICERVARLVVDLGRCLDRRASLWPVTTGQSFGPRAVLEAFDPAAGLLNRQRQYGGGHA
jgi:hypothetical protein